MRTTITIAFTCIFMTLNAQDINQDLLKINQAYLGQQFFMNMEYKLYKDQESLVPIQEESGKLYLNGRLRYQKIGQLETVSSEKYNLLVDHEEKIIALLGVQYSEELAHNPIDMFQIEKLLENCERTAFKEENAQQKSYTIETAESEYKSIKIFFNEETFFIEKLILDQREAQDLEQDGNLTQPRMVIIFNNIEAEPKFPENIFTYKKYLSERNGKLSCNDQFKNYTLHDQLF